MTLEQKAMMDEKGMSRMNIFLDIMLSRRP